MSYLFKSFSAEKFIYGPHLRVDGPIISKSGFEVHTTIRQRAFRHKHDGHRLSG